MSRKSWLLFAALSAIWGAPYLFIRVAVRDFTPATVVFIRLVIGAAILLPIAIQRKALRSALKVSHYIFLYACIEMIGPWFLITKAETNISSGLAGLLVATTPIWSSIFTSLSGDRSVWHDKRLMGLTIGFVGVFILVGIESFSGSSPFWAILFVLLAAVGYAYAVIMITKKAPEESSIAINAIAMTMAALVYLPFALIQWPSHKISPESFWSVIALGVLCTAIAFIIFFIVIAEIGPARTSLVTYLNTAFAVLLGVAILSEPLTLGIVIGLPMVLVGSYFASRKTTSQME